MPWSTTAGLQPDSPQTLWLDERVEGTMRITHHPETDAHPASSGLLDACGAKTKSQTSHPEEVITAWHTASKVSRSESKKPDTTLT